MKEPAGTLARTFASILLAAWCAPPALAQTPESLPELVGEFAEVAAAAENPLPLQALLHRILDAGGLAENATIGRSTLQLLETATTWEALANEADKLLATVREHRLDPQPERLAPVILLLSRVAPQRATVQHAAVELWGAVSPVRDPDRALAALTRLRDLVPEEHDGSSRLSATLRELAEFVGADADEDAPDEAEMLGVLWRYWNTSRALLGMNEPPRRLGPAELAAMRHLGAIDRAYRDGDQKVLVERLKAWGNAQPENRVPAVLLACAYASYGNYNPSLAKRTIEGFEPQNGAGWSFATERCVLGQFGLEILTPKDLQLLVDDLANTKEARLEMADRRMLEAQLRRSESKLAKLRDAMEKTQQKAAHDKQVYEGLRAAPKGRSRGTFDQKAATRRSNLATAFRNLKHSESDAKFALERYQKEELKIRIWRARSARYDPTR
ncbi:MAG: hypothetical protein KDE27_00770 [Planctomycetes bacterium]|nr:hypothetical protein [Planctomycetota bacterium]